jgi:hypothetical protein
MTLRTMKCSIMTHSIMIISIMTISIMTDRIMIHCIVTHCIVTLSIMTLSIITFSILAIGIKGGCYAEWHLCWLSFILVFEKYDFMLSVIMRNVVMLSVMVPCKMCCSITSRVSCRLNYNLKANHTLFIGCINLTLKINLNIFILKNFYFFLLFGQQSFCETVRSIE